MSAGSLPAVPDQRCSWVSRRPSRGCGRRRSCGVRLLPLDQGVHEHAQRRRTSPFHSSSASRSRWPQPPAIGMDEAARQTADIARPSETRTHPAQRLYRRCRDERARTRLDSEHVAGVSGAGRLIRMPSAVSVSAHERVVEGRWIGNPVVHFELIGPDPARLRDFYSHCSVGMRHPGPRSRKACRPPPSTPSSRRATMRRPPPVVSVVAPDTTPTPSSTSA